MKKNFLVILMVVLTGLLIMLSGCSKSMGSMQIIRTGGSSEYKSGMFGTIKSNDELDLFIKKNSIKYNLSYDTSSYSTGTISFLKRLKNMTQNFLKISI